MLPVFYFLGMFLSQFLKYPLLILLNISDHLFFFSQNVSIQNKYFEDLNIDGYVKIITIILMKS